MDPIRPWLYIGKYRETLEEDSLLFNGIGAVLQLAEAVSYSRMIALYLPVEDGEPLAEEFLQQGVEFVLSQKQKGHHVSFQCRGNNGI